jgi:hypothetical protein
MLACPSALWARRLGLAVSLLVVATATVACGSNGTTTIATPPSTGFTPAGTQPVDTAPQPAGSTAAPGTVTTLGPPTLTDASTISTVGLDKVHFGMTVPEAEKAAGSRLISDDAKNPSCYLAKLESGPAGVSFLVSDSRIERVDITGGKVSTRSKVHVGSTVAEVNAAYPGQIEEQARPDGQPGKALVFVPVDEADAKFRLVFMTDGASVQLYRAGRLPQVLAASGCK